MYRRGDCEGIERRVINLIMATEDGGGGQARKRGHGTEVAGALDITIGDEDKNSTRWEYKH